MIKKPQPLLLDELYKKLTPSQLSVTRAFFSNGFGLALNVGPVFRKMIKFNEPYLIEDYRFGYVSRGEMHTVINLIDRKITPGHVMFVTPGSIIEPLTVSEDVEIMGMSLSRDLLHIAMADSIPTPFDGKIKDGVMPIGEADMTLASRLFALLYDVLNTPDHNPLVMNGLISSIVGLWSGLFADASQADAHSVAAVDIFNRFISLVNQHCNSQHRLAFYADRLCITERYLGAAVRQASGVTAKDWIDRAVISSAKVMLKHSEHTTQEIADRLNFPNASFFCKYFKRLTGLTPQAYRNS